MTIETIANAYGFNRYTIQHRIVKHGLKKQRGANYSKDEIEQVIYQKHSKIVRPPLKLIYSKDALNAIDLFLTTKDNSCAVIAKKLNMSFDRVSNAINHYLKTKVMIVESKMNFE